MRNEGSLDAMKIADLLRAMNMKPLIKNVDKLTGATKPNQKKITFEEFMPIYKEVTKNKDTGSYEDFIEAMKVYDKEQNGTIIEAELRHLMLALGERLTDAQVEEIMRLCGNVDDDGNTKYEGMLCFSY